jgi:putative peptide zinc metalloprotease protein
MNLTQVLGETIPAPPSARMTESYPRAHPKLIARDHYEREGHMVHIIVPDGPSHFFRFSKQQYELIKMFDGRRSYKQIADLFTRTQRVAINEAFVRTFADNMDKKEFWYRTPQEESLALYNKLAKDRKKALDKKHGKSGHGDLAIIELVYFDPDKYLTWIHEKLKFVFGARFTIFQIFMVVVMCGILGSRWDEVWNDSVKFYNFTEKSLWDLVEFFGIFVVLGAVHETAHGMTCKHFGGESHKMGAFLMYLMPGVFCDVTQIYIYGGRWARVATLLAGVWSEIIICTWVTILWWLTPQGTWLHEISYKFILSGGIFVLIINLNPLARMDGYYIFCELTRFFDLKGNSTALLSNAVRKYIFRMPATVPVMEWRRTLFFMAYAAVAGLYSYGLLLFFVKISYRIMYRYSPEWAFVPATWLAFLIFRGRIKKLMAFLKTLWLDKRELLAAHRYAIAGTGAVIVLLSLIPFWRDSVEERFVLEPVNQAVVRTTVPGTVLNTSAEEGQMVQSGQTIASLSDPGAEGRTALARAESREASARTVQAQLRYASLAPVEQQRQKAAEGERIARDRQQALTLAAPIAGTVLTKSVHDLVGSYVAEGTLVAEIADMSTMRARIYIPEPELEKLQKINYSVLRLDSKWRPLRAEVESVGPASNELPAGIVPPAKFKGMHPPAYYVLNITVPNTKGELLVGMTGTAKVYGERRSLAWVVLGPTIETIARRVW